MKKTKIDKTVSSNSTDKKTVPSFIEHQCLCKEEKLSIDLQTRMPFQLTDYIPIGDKPLKFICINLHIFRNQAETKNFSKKNIGEFKQMFEWINEIYTNQMQPPNYLHICNSNPALQQRLDSRVRFLLNRIEFYKDDNLANQAINEGYSLLLNAMLQRDSSMDSQLNIFITAPDTNQWAAGYTQFPSSNLNFKQYIHSWHKMPSQANYNTVGYGWAQHFAHEIGHALGVPHTYGGANCNESDPFYLYDIHGCFPTKVCPIPSSAPNNNLMGGKESWSISTLQIATIHYSLDKLSVKQYTENVCCPKCVAFGASIDRHKSQGGEHLLQYTKILANESSAFDGKVFTCPVDGIYNFSMSFQKDSLVDGGTSKNVWVHLMADWDIIGTIMSEKADAKTDWSPSLEQFGRRDTVSVSLNIKLKKGVIVKTIVKSDNGDFRNIVDVTFSGHLLCPCCC
ncbi:hypothetical protein [Flavobacterium filum]|uniref:C1q-like domain-containing protein n=1 Tax=Flavobacterium filum TaxID=370974 RepID=UPI0023F239F2|nr:hypothetical protein [Flavobacterium filum]